MIKRTMFGRANFDLLRKRILSPYERQPSINKSVPEPGSAGVNNVDPEDERMVAAVTALRAAGLGEQTLEAAESLLLDPIQPQGPDGVYHRRP